HSGIVVCGKLCHSGSGSMAGRNTQAEVEGWSDRKRVQHSVLLCSATGFIKQTHPASCLPLLPFTAEAAAVQLVAFLYSI
ncbi:hypothetical protein XELAEV_18022840mg, partial [Xenopus laevis]